MKKADEILFFLCLNDRGGAEISMITLAERLRLRDRRVTLAVYGAKSALARELGFHGDIIDLAVRKTWMAGFPLLRLLSRKRFSTVISALPYTNIVAALAVMVARISSTPTLRLILTEHGIEGLTACKKSPLFASLIRFSYKRATTIVTVSQKLAQQWRGFLIFRTPPIMTIYNPTVPDVMPPAPPPAHVWLAQKEIPVLIAIGRLKPEKNFSLLLQAFARVSTRKEVYLVILGEGEQRSVLENLARDLNISDKVAMPGFLPNVAAWLAHASLFVSTSDREGFGNAIVEALAHGVPVVATDCPYGPAEILEGGRYGKLVPMNDTKALVSAIEEALTTTVAPQLLHDRAMNFTVNRCIASYLKLVDGR